MGGEDAVPGRPAEAAGVPEDGRGEHRGQVPVDGGAQRLVTLQVNTVQEHALQLAPGVRQPEHFRC